MNELAIRVSAEDKYSFALLVDGLPIGDLVGASLDSVIPFWLVGDGLPTLPPHGGPVDDWSIRIAAVCSCGEYGCAHVRCRIREDGESVVFDEFDFDVSAEGRKRRFTFSRSNYEAVVREIVALADEEGRTHHETIFVALIDERTDLWRPVRARALGGDMYKLLGVDEDTSTETWQFPEGSTVKCELKRISFWKRALAAVARIERKG